jgi:DNA polymerase-1
LDRTRFVLDENYLRVLTNRIKVAGKVAFDIEDSDLSNSSSLVGFGLAWREWDQETKKEELVSVYVPVGHITNHPQIRIDIALEYLQEIADSCLLLIFNATYELRKMLNYGVTLPNFRDVRHYACAFDESYGKKGLKAIADTHLGLKWGKIKDVAGRKTKGKTVVDTTNSAIESLGDYCRGDVEATYLLDEFFADKVEYAETVIGLEEGVTRVVVDMERRGVHLDLPSLDKRLAKVEVEIEEARCKLFQAAGQVFNPASPKQVANLLFNTLELPEHKGRSTDIETLEYLRGSHVVVDNMMVFREKEKLKSTYLLPLREKSVNARIYTSFNQLGPETGRFSSNNPNLQNIPATVRDKKTKGIDLVKDPGIRQLFIPTPGWVFFDADYSQIEGRIFAHVSGDPVLTKYYREGGDIHTATSEKLGIDRSLAKCINFAIIYGAYAKKLVEIMLKAGYTYEVKEAKDMIKAFWSTYKVGHRWVINVKETLRTERAAYTVFGRRRRFLDINTADELQQFSMEREAVNFAIQGTAADIMKFAMVDVSKALKKAGDFAYILLTVHDELLFEVLPEYKDLTELIVKNRMRDCVTLSVPLEVEGRFGTNWAEVH